MNNLRIKALLKRQRIALAILGAAFTLAGSGCATASSATEVTTASSADSMHDAAARTNTSDEADSDWQAGEAETPMSRYWAMLHGVENMNNAEIIRNHIAAEARVQELVAQCMHNAGFEFIINLPENNPAGFDPDLWRRDDPDWIARFGMGVIVAPSHGTPLPGGADQFGMGPNIEMLEELSTAERAAWHEAHTGPGGNWDLGCVGQAMTQHHQETPWGMVESDTEFAPLMEAMLELDTRLWQDRDNSEWTRDWANCMADAGHPGLERLGDERSAFWDYFTSFEVRERLGISFWNEIIYTEGLVLSSELRELQNQEIEMAFTSFDCINSVNFWERDIAHRTEVQQQFVADHRVALTALEDALVQSGLR